MEDSKIKGISAAIGFGVSGISWLTYTGPYQWLTDMQIQVIGEYYPMLSFILPAVAIGFVIERVWTTLECNEYSESRAKSKSIWFNQSSHVYQMGGAATGLLFVALWLLLPAWTSNSEIQEVSARAIEQGEIPSSSWITVSGTMLWDECIVEEDGAIETYFIPVVSDDWQPGQPVATFVKLNQSEADALWEEEKATFDGMLTPGGLSNFYKNYFIELDDIQVADTNIFLDQGTTPEFNRNCGLVCMVGCWMLGLGAIMMFNGNPQITETSPLPAAETFATVAAPDGGQAVTPAPLAPAPPEEDEVDAGVLDWMKNRGLDAGHKS